MCGIMGFVGQAKDAQASELSYQLATKLLSETVSRGHHATGAYIVYPPQGGDTKNKVFVYKLDAPATQFVRTKNWKGVKKKGDPSLLLGHCRFYTHGSPQDHINNHPHVSDDRRLAVIHNGVISSYATLKGRYPCKGECDSEVILRIIESQPDILTGIKKVFQEITGSMSCMVSHFDKETKKTTFYAFRNDGNPLQFLDLREQLGQIFLSSTKEIATAALKNSGMPKEIRDVQIQEIESFKIYQTTSESLVWEITDIEKPVTTTYRTTTYGGCQSTGTTTTTSFSNSKKTVSEKVSKIRSYIDNIVANLTEIDQALEDDTQLSVDQDELATILEDAAWDLEKIVNPQLVDPDLVSEQ